MSSPRPLAGSARGFSRSATPADPPPLSAEIPSEVPASFVAGDTVKFTRRYADYPASAGWVLTFAFAGVDTFAGTCTQNGTGDDFLVALAAATTAAKPAGVYQYLASATLAGEVYTVDSGSLVVLPNVRTAAAGALQSHAEKMVALLEAALVALASSGTTAATVQSYTIGDRSVTYRDVPDLHRELQGYRWQVWREQHPGQLGPRRQVRFVG